MLVPRGTTSGTRWLDFSEFIQAPSRVTNPGFADEISRLNRQPVHQEVTDKASSAGGTSACIADAVSVKSTD